MWAMARTKQNEPEVDETLARQSDEPIPMERDERQRVGPKKITLKLTDEGRINWDLLPDEQMEAFKDAAQDDEVARALFGTSDAASAIGAPNTIEPRHVGALLEILAVVERIGAPIVFERKFKVKLHPRVVDAAFRFNDKAKDELGPDGAVTLNMLPERVRGWIITACSPSAFMTKLGEIIKQQFEAAFQMQARVLAQERAQHGRPVEVPAPVGAPDTDSSAGAGSAGG